MTVSKLFVSAALVTAALLAFLQLGLTSASAGRGCKMGADCYYNSQGQGSSHQARQPVDKKLSVFEAASVGGLLLFVASRAL